MTQKYSFHHQLEPTFAFFRFKSPNIDFQRNILASSIDIDRFQRVKRSPAICLCLNIKHLWKISLTDICWSRQVEENARKLNKAFSSHRSNIKILQILQNYPKVMIIFLILDWWEVQMRMRWYFLSPEKKLWEVWLRYFIFFPWRLNLGERVKRLLILDLFFFHLNFIIIKWNQIILSGTCRRPRFLQNIFLWIRNENLNTNKVTWQILTRLRNVCFFK